MLNAQEKYCIVVFTSHTLSSLASLLRPCWVICPLQYIDVYQPPTLRSNNILPAAANARCRDWDFISGCKIHLLSKACRSITNMLDSLQSIPFPSSVAVAAHAHCGMRCKAIQFQFNSRHFDRPLPGAYCSVGRAISPSHMASQVFASCFAGVYNEYLLKGKSGSVHTMIQNCFMYSGRRPSSCFE